MKCKIPYGQEVFLLHQAPKYGYMKTGSELIVQCPNVGNS